MNKIIISSHELKRGLHKLGNVILSKPVLPALGNILCKVGKDYVEMVGSDTETTILYKLEAETSGEFEFLLPYALISKIVSLTQSGSEPMKFEMTGNKLKIATDDGQYELKHLDKVEDFPKLPQVPKKNSISINNEIIRTLKIASQTTGKDEQRPAMMKVLMELRSDKITVASTDGNYSLFTKSLPIKSETDGDLLISQKVIKSIEDMADTTVSWNERAIVFEDGNTTVIVTRANEKFPNFRAIIPADHNSNITLNRLQLINALEKCNINSGPLKEMTLNLDGGDKIVFNSDDEMLIR